MHRQSVAKLEDDLASERAARVLEAQQTRNMAGAMMHSLKIVCAPSAILLTFLSGCASPPMKCPSPPDVPQEMRDTRPAVAVLSDGVRADLVRLAKEADAAADQLRAWQTVRGMKCKSATAQTVGTSYGQKVTAEELSYGECRHSPPSIFVMEDEPVTLFPMVDAESFCGQHKAAQ